MCKVTAIAIAGLNLILAQPLSAKNFKCSAGNVQCLIDAINEANTNGHNQNKITLDAGTYKLTSIDNDTNLKNGLPSITSTLTVKGAGAGMTFIARDPSAVAFRIMHVSASGNVTLDGLTLMGGRQTQGAGLHNQGGMVTLTDSAVAGNVSDSEGAGLFNTGTMKIIRSSVTDNIGFHEGAAFFNTGGTVTADQSTFGDNTSDGGAITTENGALLLTDSRLTGNTGSVHVAGLSVSGGTVVISRSTFDHNSGMFGGGGAVSVGGGALIGVTDSAFTENSTTTGGAGFQSPGIFISDTATIFVVNTTFANNVLKGTSSGRGIAIHNVSGGAFLLNNTVVDNNAELPSGIDSALLTGSSATTVLLNTIVAGNTNNPLTQDCSGPTTSQGNNLIGSLTGCISVLQPSDLTGDPGLGTFADNGTPGNGHFPLLGTSRAINAGNGIACPHKDQIGTPRKARCDIGAIEHTNNSNSSKPKAEKMAVADERHSKEAKHSQFAITILEAVHDSSVDSPSAAIESQIREFQEELLRELTNER